jgi:hypothetical protein
MPEPPYRTGEYSKKMVAERCVYIGFVSSVCLRLKKMRPFRLHLMIKGKIVFRTNNVMIWNSDPEISIRVIVTLIDVNVRRFISSICTTSVFMAWYRSCRKVNSSNFLSQRQSYITTNSQSASPSWCQASIWDPRPIFPLLSLIIFRQLRVSWYGAPSLTRGRKKYACNPKGIIMAARQLKFHFYCIIFRRAKSCSFA